MYRLRLVGIVAAGVAGAAGWNSVDPAAPAAAAQRPTDRGARPSSGSIAVSSARPPSLPVPSRPAGLKGRRISPDLVLPEQARALLALDPATAAREATETMRAPRRAECKAKLPEASDAYCERILQVHGSSGVAFITTMQAFMRGNIDQDTYQSEMHKTFLEHQLALEAFMPARDFLAYMAVQPGEDSFMILLGEFQNVPAGYKLGDELFDPSIHPYGNTHEPPARDESTPSTKELP
jgi:hypothetical protein